jgi:hypothetical protein
MPLLYREIPVGEEEEWISEVLGEIGINDGWPNRRTPP